jgi:hypothetical protein
MKLRDTMICWNGSDSSRGEPLTVEAGPHPDLAGWSNRYDCSDGACWLIDWPKHSDDERLLRLFVMFAILVIRDRVPAETVHRAFLAVDEYREALPPDVPGRRP